MGARPGQCLAAADGLVQPDDAVLERELGALALADAAQRKVTELRGGLDATRGEIGLTVARSLTTS